MIKKILLLLLCCFPLLVSADGKGTAVAYIQKNQAAILKDYMEFLAIPNEASDVPNIRRTADWIIEAMTKRGLNPRKLQATDPDAPPAVYGSLEVPGATRTLLFYAHYDGQPADAEGWKVTEPWKPVFRQPGSTKNMALSELTFPVNPDMRIYGRSTSDDKAGVMAVLTALDAARNSSMRLTSNLKFFFEGEEEAGSPHLDEITAAHKDLLRADAWILVDGPVHPSGRKQVVFGVRGDANVDITVYGPLRPLHSGHYGNWAPNPALLLARLLSSMKDNTGRTIVEGWYDDVTPLSELEREAIRKAPAADATLKKELGLAQTENPGKSLLEVLMEPSLNINGIRSADVGPRARNVIPTIAEATLDLRMVKGNEPQRQFEKLVRHIEKQGFTVIDHEPTAEERLGHERLARVVLLKGSYSAQRTAMDLPISQFVIKAVTASVAEPPVVLPSLGGSLPLSIVEKNTGSPLITVPMANHDNNQHAEDENIRIGNFWSGIETLAALFTYSD